MAALTAAQGIFLGTAALLTGAAVVHERRVKARAKGACLSKIYSEAPEPLREDITTRLNAEAQAVTQGKKYYLTPDAQARAFELLAKAYTNEWWPRSWAIRQVLAVMAPDCNWFADQRSDYSAAMGIVWQSMWTLAATVEADMGINRGLTPDVGRIISREKLGRGLGPNGAQPVDTKVVMVVSDPEGLYTEPVAALAVDEWTMENGIVIQDFKILGHQVGGTWRQPYFYKIHGLNMGDPISAPTSALLET